MEKKYEFVEDSMKLWRGRTIRRIVAIRDFDDVKKGVAFLQIEEIRN